MKTIGLLGGMSWESTELYYRGINQGVNRALGGLHSARIVLLSVDFQEIEVLQHLGRWEVAGELLADGARRVEAAGADFVLICTNTMHKVAPQIEQGVAIPVLHLADATAQHIRARNMSRVGLLGTRFTMEEDFYKGRLAEQGLEVLIPTEAERALVHQVIYEELCLGVIDEASRAEFVRIVAQLQARGAQGVILGCTEIVMLLRQSDTEVPLFDTTQIHVDAAVASALA